MSKPMIHLTAGHRYVGTIVGILNGELVYRDVEFTAAHDGEPKDVNDDAVAALVVSHPRHPDKHAVRTYVAGSIREIS